MPYEKQTWVNEVTPLDAAHLNHMEDGIEAANELPQASDDNLGGVKASPKTASETNEVKIDTATGKLYASGGTQVNADWNATSGVAKILNKPTIPTQTSQLTNDSGYITNTANAFSYDNLSGKPVPYVLPQASEDNLGGIKASPKTDSETNEVKIDITTGKLYASGGGGGSGGSAPLYCTRNIPFPDSDFFELSGDYLVPDCPNGNPWSNFAYGNGRYVWIDSGGEYTISCTDFWDWTDATPLPIAIGTCMSFKFLNGYFIALPFGGNTIAISIDGQAWGSAHIENGQWYDCAYGGGVYMAIEGPGGSHRYATATDIYAWNAPATITVPNFPDWAAFFSVCYGKGKFAIGTNMTASGCVIYSENLASNTWASAGANLGNGESAAFAMLFDGEYFIVFGLVNEIAYSGDLQTWQLVQTPNTEYPEESPAHTIYANGLHIAAFPQYAPNNFCLVSVDLTHWQMVTVPVSDSGSIVGGIVYNGNGFVLSSTDSHDESHILEGKLRINENHATPDWFSRMPAINDVFPCVIENIDADKRFFCIAKMTSLETFETIQCNLGGK